MGNARNIAFWVVLFVLILALFQLFSGSQATMSARTMPYSQFIEKVDAGEVRGVVIDGEQIEVQTTDVLPSPPTRSLPPPSPAARTPPR